MEPLLNFTDRGDSSAQRMQKGSDEKVMAFLCDYFWLFLPDSYWLFSPDANNDEQSLQLYRRFGVQRFVNKIPFGSCSAGKLQCCIRPDGSVVPCVGWNEVVIGNIENDSFKDISSSFDMKKLREKDIKCKKCELADFCDVCPMFFYQDTGSSSTVSPEICRHASFRQKVYLEGNCASGD